MNQDGLIKVGLWCIGEFGNLLVNGKAVGPDNLPINVNDEEVLKKKIKYNGIYTLLLFAAGLISFRDLLY